MGQTLSHGVYLPNEGERNCYAGLASNWQILNTAVGSIAEKAPLVHTHGNISNDGKVGTTANLPLITGTGGAVQAGAFGNQANTFCEGNDSRLSDARTPLSHTHTKSDVTDLLNSNFIPSANNSYDLGSSSYQWNNVYSKRVNTQTLNGVNPGALGIPSGVKQSISEYITNVNLGWSNQVTAVRDGYIVVTIADAAGNSIFIFNNTKQYSNSCYGNGSQGTGRLSCMLPVNEGDVIYIFIKAAALSDVFSADLYVMNGNVNALPSS